LSRGGERKMKLCLFARFVIIVTVAISATDAIVFWRIQEEQTKLTWPFVIEVIIITIIPIVVNLWYWLVFKKEENKKQGVILWLCVGFGLMVCWLLALAGIL
jgi:heme/copper-type cytochrome/quinol oxidase subunit 4